MVADSLALARGRSGVIVTKAAGTVFRDAEYAPEMVVIPAGSFLMGSPKSETGRSDSEGPQHRVTIALPVAVGKFTVTFDEFDACVADGGCSHKPHDRDRGRGRRPVIDVSWEDAKAYTEWLSQKTGTPYRLLTEAEWEYAARAATSTAYSFGDIITSQQANYDETHEGTVPVGCYPANAFGLHDMHGNVWEWTEDCWNANYTGAPSDGSAWTTGDCGQRVRRGGSWSNYPRNLRSASRNRGPAGNRYDVNGFRVSRTL